MVDARRDRGGASSAPCSRGCCSTRTAPSPPTGSSTTSGASSVPDSAQKMVQIYVSAAAQGPARGPAPDTAARLRRRGRAGEHRPRPVRAAAARGRRGACGGQRRAGGAALRRGARAVARGRARRVPGAVRAAEASRLEELQLACLEARIAADLDRGRHAELVARARAAARAAIRCARACGPSNCSPCTGRGGSRRRSPAYRAFRDRLADELGLEPSPRLRGARAPDPASGCDRSSTTAGASRAPRRASRYVRNGDVSDRLPERSATASSTSCWCTAGYPASSPAGSARRSRGSMSGWRRWGA